MRPGRPGDLSALFQLWQGEIRAGRQDATPNEDRLRRMLARFDWEARSRVVEAPGGRIAGAVLVTSRGTPQGVIANVHVAGEPEAALELARWGAFLCRASGASVTQCFIARGHGAALEAAGFKNVRPWWRMDRTLSSGVPEPRPVPGYDLVDGTLAEPGTWEEMFNRSFADHWRFTPRTEDELVRDKRPELCLMAVTSPDRVPASITIGEVETYREDPRAQPVGLISSVGTVPEHRRRGLAAWLVAEAMVRLRQAGACSASLYVDGMNPMRAFDAYRKLGFALAFEAEVWEASQP